MSQDFMLLQQLLSGGGSAWLLVTLLGGLLLVLIFRPNSIHNPYLFRAACWLLGISVIIPPLLHLLMSSMTMNFSGGMGYGSMRSGSGFLLACVNGVGPILQGVSILCALFSLIPPMTPRQPDIGPVKHPME